MATLRRTILNNPTFYLEAIQKIKLSDINTSQTYSIEDSIRILQNMEVEEQVQKKKCANDLKLKYIKLCQLTLVRILNQQSGKSEVFKKEQLLKKKKKQIEYQESFIQMMKKQVREERAKLSNIMKNQKRKKANSIRNEPQHLQKKQQIQDLRKTQKRASSIDKPTTMIKDQEMDVNITMKTNGLFKPNVRTFGAAKKNLQNQKTQQKNQLNTSQKNNFKYYEQKLLGIKKSQIPQIQEVQVIDFDLDMPLTLSIRSIKELHKKKQSQITCPPQRQHKQHINIKLTSSSLRVPKIEVPQNQQDNDDFSGFQLKEKSKSSDSQKSIVDINLSSQQEGQDDVFSSKRERKLNQSCKITSTNTQPKLESRIDVKDSFLRQIKQMDLKSRRVLAKLKPVPVLEEVDEQFDLKATVKSCNPIRKN